MQTVDSLSPSALELERMESVYFLLIFAQNRRTMEQFAQIISRELSISLVQAKNTLALMGEGCTVPFISRYRKEVTGGLDEVQIADVFNRSAELDVLAKRKETILKTIAEQGKLTPELEKEIAKTWDPNILEDIYLPYKPKRKTRATIAKEKGLEPLAEVIFAQRPGSIAQLAKKYLGEHVATEEEAIEGAKDIIAEWVNENTEARSKVRINFERTAQLATKLVKGKEEEGAKYQDYFNFSEKLDKCPSHRVLAVMRAENEGILKVSIDPDDETSEMLLSRLLVRSGGESSALVKEAVSDSYKRLMKPSIEKEFYKLAKDKADAEAIKIFAENLRQLLLAAPVGAVRTLALDPGYRTGCKLVCLNEHGDLLHNETIYPHPPQSKEIDAARKINQLVESYQIQAIAIGNGTAGRETEAFIKRMKFYADVKVFVVNESGASIYSASKVAREEFPDYDVTVRGAVSIGRRLMDPLAELVKIDPKSIGVGQYQHDVDQTNLQQSLTQVVESCVNMVGVDVNTASKHLLTYISGLGPQLAENIVKFRSENGEFSERKQLLKVPRMGPKAYQQAAGFLRIRNGKNPLDNSAVHPESYHIVEKMAKDKGVKVSDLLNDKTVRDSIQLDKYTSAEVGLPTLTDIKNELAKPGRDPRQGISTFAFDDTIKEFKDLKEGMVLPGMVTNLTNFGAFVDIGVKENGLIHISNITTQFISSPADVLKLNQQVRVKIIALDHERKRIQLAMKGIDQK